MFICSTGSCVCILPEACPVPTATRGRTCTPGRPGQPLRWGSCEGRGHGSEWGTARSRYNTTNFIQNTHEITIDTSKLDHVGELWGVFCVSSNYNDLCFTGRRIPRCVEYTVMIDRNNYDLITLCACWEQCFTNNFQCEL